MVGARSDTLVNHHLDIVIQFVDQVNVAACKLLLGTQRNDLPVGGIHAVDDILDLALAHLAGELLCQVGNLVHGGNLATHVDGLRHRECSTHQVMDIIGQAALGQQCHSRGHVLAVDLDRIACCGINEQIVIVGARLRIERLGGQHLVLLDERHLARIIDVACREVKLRQISSGSLLTLITRFFNGQCSLFNFLIVA